MKQVALNRKKEGEGMKKLYVATAELMIYVMAESERDAMSQAEEGARLEMDNLTYAEFDARRAVGTYDANWADAYPYNSDDNRSVQEIFEAEKEKEAEEKRRIEFEKRQLKLF